MKRTTLTTRHLNNQVRRDRAEIALTSYMPLMGVDEPEDVLVDLVTDLRHWCEKRSSCFSFDEAVARSLSHFLAEVADDTQKEDDTTMDTRLHQLLDFAQRHGMQDDPEHEVGDLQDVVFACWDLLTDQQRQHVHTTLAQQWETTLDDS